MLEIKIFKDGELLKQAQGNFFTGSLLSDIGAPGSVKAENMIIGGSVSRKLVIINQAELCARTLAAAYDSPEERKAAAGLFISSFIETAGKKMGI